MQVTIPDRVFTNMARSTTELPVPKLKGIKPSDAFNKTSANIQVIRDGSPLYPEASDNDTINSRSLRRFLGFSLVPTSWIGYVVIILLVLGAIYYFAYKKGMLPWHKEKKAS